MRSPSTISASAPSPARANASEEPCTSDTTCTRMRSNLLPRRLSGLAPRLEALLARERDGLGRALAPARLGRGTLRRRGLRPPVRARRVRTQVVVQERPVQHRLRPHLPSPHERPPPPPTGSLDAA